MRHLVFIFSAACDKRTDISGTAQLALFLCSSDVVFDIFKELLELILLSDTTIGKDVFLSFYELLKKCTLPLWKLSLVATDGTLLMTRKNTGFL